MTFVQVFWSLIGLSFLVIFLGFLAWILGFFFYVGRMAAITRHFKDDSGG